MIQKDILIHETESVKDSLKKLDKTAKKVLLVINNKNTLLGTITDGDIRRYILSGKSLDSDIKRAYNKKPLFLKKKDFSINRVKKILLKNRIELLPIVDNQKKVLDFKTWDQVFSKDATEKLKKSKIDIPVVIMAGGRGNRLEPFTKIISKALIPIGDKPIIEIIIDEFKKQGVEKYFLTLNHKSEMVKSYFNSADKDYEIQYVEERKFLGTAGSLKLLENNIDDLFIVSNCDVIVKANFEDVIGFHKKQKASLTVLSSIKHYEIPYGIVKRRNGGEVIDILEKPEYTFTINTGVYILNRNILRFIPKNKSFDMPDLIKNLIKNNKKIVMYPVNENDYVDIGQWEEYKKALEKIQFFK